MLLLLTPWACYERTTGNGAGPRRVQESISAEDRRTANQVAKETYTETKKHGILSARQTR